MLKNQPKMHLNQHRKLIQKTPKATGDFIGKKLQIKSQVKQRFNHTNTNRRIYQKKYRNTNGKIGNKLFMNLD